MFLSVFVRREIFHRNFGNFTYHIFYKHVHFSELDYIKILTLKGVAGGGREKKVRPGC